jgi:hypothetical protein
MKVMKIATSEKREKKGEPPDETETVTETFTYSLEDDAGETVIVKSKTDLEWSIGDEIAFEETAKQEKLEASP